MLEEGVSDHRQERMTVKALPGLSLEVIETEFFFQLLVSLLANPSRLDSARFRYRPAYSITSSARANSAGGM
jgi:hypothetical protein